MPPLNSEHRLKLFLMRYEEADPKAREVLAEFIRVVRERLDDERVLREIDMLEETWRDSLSDSQVIRHLRALHPVRKTRK